MDYIAFAIFYGSLITARKIIHTRESDTWQGLRICLFTIASRPALRPIKTPIQWVKRPGHKANHSPESNADVKKRLHRDI